MAQAQAIFEGHQVVGRLRGLLRRLLCSIEDIVVPPVCQRCHSALAAEGRFGRFLCPDCEALVSPFKERLPRCPLCGGRSDGLLSACSECAATPRPWFRGVSVFPYKSECGDLLRDFKYNGHTELSAFFGAAMAWAWQRYGSPARPEFIIPIPLHWRRRLTRGYNQSELLAKELGTRLHLPVMKGLSRRSSTQHQSRLDAADRLKNLQGAFCVVHPEQIAGRRVLLLDDVFTTGATLTAASALLQQAGAAEISVITVARA